MDITKVPMKDVFAKFGVEDTTIDFMGHAIALQFSDTYLYEPAIETIRKM
jgi:Rab GDP dissociation inhibitor